MTGITCRFKHTVKCPDFTSAMRPLPHKVSGKSIFNYDISDSDRDHEQQEGDNVDCNLTFEASCSLSEPRLQTQ